MLKHENKETLASAAQYVDEYQNGIYAYPHETKNDKEETIKAVQKYIKEYKQKES